MRLRNSYVLIGLTPLFIIMNNLSLSNSIMENQKSSVDSENIVKSNFKDSFLIIKHNDSSNHIIESFSIHSTNDKLPFTGVRYFETRPAVSGTGTAQLSIEIRPNRKVIFHYWQNNTGKDWNDPTKFTEATYNAGKFQRIIKCDFSKLWEDFPRYYVVTTNYIYEVDSIGDRLYKNDCCTNENAENESIKCYCEGELWIP